MITEELTKERVEKLHAQMVFVHQRLIGLQYFADEFDIARDALQTITNYCNNLFELKKLNEEPKDEPKKEG